MTLLLVLRDILLLSVLLSAALLPWWAVGRALIPARERLPVRELGLGGIHATLRRGAAAPVWSPPHRDL